MIGTTVGNYEIVEEVGRGGMAVVYRAYQAKVDRFVAVKVIRSAVLDDPQVRKRFEREARLIARLEHPHLLPIYDFDGEHDPPYLVMRFIEGSTLKNIMHHKRLANEDILHLMRQIASALDFAHRQNVIHRDLKPSNIMLDREGHAFVMDFGIARLADGDSEFTHTGTIMGTPSYMAPEQAISSPNISQAADIYSLGVILFEMLTGELPFKGDSPMEQLAAHIHNIPPSVTEIDPTLPARLDLIIQPALSKEPHRRFKNAQSMLQALEEILDVNTTVQTQIHLLTQEVMTLITEQRAIASVQTDVFQKSSGSSSSLSLNEQKKQVTVLHADFREFNELLYQLYEEEQAHEHRAAFWREIDRLLALHGGYTHDRTDSTLIAVWGAKTTRENDPEQAIFAALEIKTHLQAALQTHDDDDEAPLPCKIGIMTGPILFTMLRAEQDTQTLSGIPLILSGRVKDAAAQGEITLAEETYDLVSGIFDVEKMSALKIRGRDNPLGIYKLVRARPQALRVKVRGVEGIQTSLVGREAEQKLLQDALTLVSEDAELQMITLVGEAGVGKSRLIYEFAQWSSTLRKPPLFLKARSTQQSTQAPYSLFRDLFTILFEILDTDPSLAVHEKFERGFVQYMGFGHEEKAQFVGQLLGYDFSHLPSIKSALALGEDENLQGRATSYLNDFFRAITKRHPVLIYFEDLHWSDERSLDLINQIAHENQAIALLMVCATRPELLERRPTWGEGKRYSKNITLEPLSRLDSRRLVRDILHKVDEVPQELRDLIVDRAEGNPFYIEELIKVLISDGVIQKHPDHWSVNTNQLANVRIPATLTGVIQAQLDALSGELYAVMQYGAIVGRIFWDQAILYLSDVDQLNHQYVLQLLKELHERELITKREPSAFEGAIEYIFNHNILWDVTYESVVPRQRRVLHQKCAEWYMLVCGDRLEEYALQIANHYRQADATDLAIDFFYQAGVKAAQVGAYGEAVKIFQEALEMLQRTEENPSTLYSRGVLLWRLGNTYDEQGNYEAARPLLGEAMFLARQLNEDKLQADSLISLGRIGWRQGNLEEALAFLSMSLSIVQPLGDQQALAEANRQLALVQYSLNNFELAKTHAEESLRFARQVHNSFLEAQVLDTLGILAMTQGQTEQAITYYQDALRLARQNNARRTEAAVLNNMGRCYMDLRDYDQAIVEIRAALQVAEDIGDALGICAYHITLGHTLLRRGKKELAQQAYQNATERATQLQHESHLIHALTGLGEVALLEKNFALAGQYFRQALENAELSQSIPNLLHILPRLARLEWHLGKPDLALKILGAVLQHPQTPAWLNAFCKQVWEEIAAPETLKTEALRQSHDQDLGDLLRQLL